MPSTGLMTFASRIIVSPYDSNNALTLGSFTLQITNVELTQKMSDVDFTNTESNGFAEWAPTTLIPSISLEGIVDVTGGFDAIQLTCMQNKTFAQVLIDMVKISLVNANPVFYQGNFLFQDSALMGKVQANGDLWRFRCSGKGIGRFIRGGASFVGGQITGFVQN